jgi:diguanylate cyclase
VFGFDIASYHIPASVALAIVALIGYLIGRRNRMEVSEALVRSRGELRRAQAVARELEKITWRVRRNLSKHHGNLVKFKQHIGQLTDHEEEPAWRDLCQEAADMLTPTLRLATQIANAYDEIRQQTNSLMSFTEVRTDPLTGISNRRGLDESLDSQLAMMSRYETGFALLIFDIDHFKTVNDQSGHLEGDRVLQRIAHLLDDSARETDIVARYGGEEFVIIMPRTDLDGACLFAERVRIKVQGELPITVSGGVAAALDGDTPDTIMARADAALYRAKAASRNCIWRNTGESIEAICEDQHAEAAS